MALSVARDTPACGPRLERVSIAPVVTHRLRLPSFPLRGALVPTRDPIKLTIYHGRHLNPCPGPGSTRYLSDFCLTKTKMTQTDATPHGSSDASGRPLA